MCYKSLERHLSRDELATVKENLSEFQHTIIFSLCLILITSNFNYTRSRWPSAYSYNNAHPQRKSYSAKITSCNELSRVNYTKLLETTARGRCELTERLNRSSAEQRYALCSVKSNISVQHLRLRLGTRDPRYIDANRADIQIINETISRGELRGQESGFVNGNFYRNKECTPCIFHLVQTAR